jgi:hypothetical protein
MRYNGGEIEVDGYPGDDRIWSLRPVDECAGRAAHTPRPTAVTAATHAKRLRAPITNLQTGDKTTWRA